MKRLIFATHNPNKVEEVRELLSDSYEILGLDDIGFTEEIIEDKKNNYGKFNCKGEIR